MAEDRCNHYVMSYTLGDAALVTKDNAYRILEDVKRAAIQDTLTEAEDRLKAELEKREESYRLASEAQSQQHEQRLAELELALEQQRAEARRHEMEVAHREAQIEALRSGQEAQKETLENADTAIVELQRSTIIGCIDAASGHERVLKIAIAFSVSIGVAIVGGVGNYLLSALTDRFWIALIILALMALTGTLTFMMTWVVPDLILGSVISKRRQRYFEKELQRRGAADYVAGWTVDWGNRTVARKADATLVSLLGLDSEGRTQPNNCGGQTSDAVLGEPVRDSAPPRPGPVALDTLVRKKKRKRRR
jgi:hypothetical protein